MQEAREAVRAAAMGGGPPVALPGSYATVVLVEGVSDLVAVETLAGRLGVGSGRALVVPLGGAMSIQRFVRVLSGVRLVGLCDLAERRFFERAGLDRVIECDSDLETELLRALGHDSVLQAMDAAGDLAAFRVFQNQPAQRPRDLDSQLHRFLGTIGGRKEKYARVLVEALDLARAPAPLLAVIEEF